MKLFIIILFIFFISFILGYAAACILYTSKKADEKQELQQIKPLLETYELGRIRKKLKDTELKVSYYITIINRIEEELKKQQFNSVINLTNKIKTIISPIDNYNVEKRKELTKTATNEND